MIGILCVNGRQKLSTCDASDICLIPELKYSSCLSLDQQSLKRFYGRYNPYPSRVFEFIYSKLVVPLLRRTEVKQRLASLPLYR